MPLVNAGAAVASAAAGAATSAAGAAAGKAAGAASAAAGAAVGAASVVSSAAGVAATAALSAKERAAQVAPAPSDAAGFAVEVGHAAGEKVVAAGQMVKGAAGEVKSMTSGIAEQAVSHASGAVEGVIEQAAKQKQRMEKLADHFKDLLEGFMKRKLHRVLKMLVGRLPSLLKSATDDVEMPTRVKRAKDAAIDVIWPDIEQEIMWDLALRIDGAAGNEYPEDYQGCTCCLSFFRYHIYPYDRGRIPGFWGNLRDPIWLLFTLVALLPVYGVSPAVFLVIFLLIDKTDEFQLVSFILQFKGFQFLTQGVLRSLVGFFMYLHCVTAVADAEHECANAGPGSSAPMAIALAGYVLQVVLVWIAFLLLPCSSRRRGTLQGHLDHTESGSSTSRGGYILNLLWYDLFTFAICAGTFVYVLSLRDWELQDWPTKHAFFAVQMVNGFLSFPFFFFMVPFLRNILLHSVPTAYDRFGRCRQYQGPPRPVKEVKEGKSIPTQLLEKAEALRILESFKTLLAGGKVDSLDAEEEPAPATLGKANVE